MKWNRVFGLLQPYLRPYGDSREGRLDFYHRALSKAVRKRFVYIIHCYNPTLDLMVRVGRVGLTSTIELSVKLSGKGLFILYIALHKIPFLLPDLTFMKAYGPDHFNN